MAKDSRRAKGTGSIYKKTVTRKGKEYSYWEASVTIGYDQGTGKQLRKTFTGKTQKEVREKMQAAAVAVQDGDYFEPTTMTLAQWLDTWLNEYCADLKFLTKQKYETVCRVHLKPALGATKLSKLTSPEIQKFYNELGRTGKEIRKKDKSGKELISRAPLSSKSIRSIHGVLSKALNTALRLGMIRRNPATLCTTPKPEKKEVDPLTDTQVKQFIKLCDSEIYGNAYKLIIFTGLRESEALGLTWDCVNFDTGIIKICKQLQRQGKEDALVPLKNNKPRYLTVPQSVLNVLKDQYNKQTEYRLRAGELWEGWQSLRERQSGLVFTKPDGSNISAAALYQRYKHLAEAIGAPKSRVHSLRHTYAVISLQNGDDVKTVQDNLGHATASFTLDVYGHVSEKMKADSAERMERYIQSMA